MVKSTDNRKRKKLIEDIPIYSKEQQDQLMYMLFRLLRYKYTDLAKLFRVTAPTAKRWWVKGLPSPWLATPMYEIIRTLLRDDHSRADSKFKKELEEVRAEFRDFPPPFRRIEHDPKRVKMGIDYSYVEAPTTAINIAFSLFLHFGPVLDWEIVKEPPYNGGYSEMTLRRALLATGAEAVTTGFGPNKKTRWTLPHDKKRMKMWRKAQRSK